MVPVVPIKPIYGAHYENSEILRNPAISRLCRHSKTFKNPEK